MGAAPASSSAALYTTLSQFSFSSKHHTPRASTLTLVYCLVYPRPTHTDLMRREGRRGSPGWLLPVIRDSMAEAAVTLTWRAQREMRPRSPRDGEK